MYALSKHSKSILESYLKIPLISSIEFNPKLGGYTVLERGSKSKRNGLLSSLKRHYYPKYVRSSRNNKRTAKKSSSIKQGQRVDSEITQYVKTGKTPKHRMSKALLEYWHANDHMLVAAQIPVYVAKFKCITQADVITRTADGQLWMNEIKTGYPPGGFRKRGEFDSLDQVPNTVYNQWHLQCYYTTLGLQEVGKLDIKGVVIQVYDDKTKGVVVKRLKNPKWLSQLEK